MLYFKSVPVVIEPGVGALEVCLVSVTRRGERTFYVPFERIDLNSTIAVSLPMIVSSAAPHVFSMSADLDNSPFLLLYDNLGKLSAVYTREQKTNVWVQNDAAPEQVGATITRPSVRFSFNGAHDRDRFLDMLEQVADKYKKRKRVVRDELITIVELLTSSKTGPVVLPIAVAKPQKPINV
jgi:hypothetical protein